MCHEGRVLLEGGRGHEGRGQRCASAEGGREISRNVS